jgi:hypothetical protein
MVQGSGLRVQGSGLGLDVRFFASGLVSQVFKIRSLGLVDLCVGYRVEGYEIRYKGLARRAQAVTDRALNPAVQRPPEKIMICDCLPIVGVLLSETLKSGQNFRIKKFLSADRSFNRRARRAGTGQTVRMHYIFGWST